MSAIYLIHLHLHSYDPMGLRPCNEVGLPVHSSIPVGMYSRLMSDIGLRDVAEKYRPPMLADSLSPVVFRFCTI